MPFSLLTRLRDIPLAVVDTETTGASADLGDRVIELGIVRVEGGKVVAEYQQLIDPRRRISPGVSALTGITQAMVQGQPTFAQQLGAALPLLQGAAVVGHNVRFDLSFLAREFRRARIDLCESLCNAPVLDTVRIARKRFGRGGNGLQRLAPRLGIVPSVAHRALADAQTTAAVLERLLEPVGGWNLSLCDAYLQQGGPMGLLAANPRQHLLPLELEEALEQQSAVMMEYVDAAEMRTLRMISPQRLARKAGQQVLVAHCHLRNDRRTFKLERIVRLTRVESGIQMPESSPPVASSPVSEGQSADDSPQNASPRLSEDQQASDPPLVALPGFPATLFDGLA